VTSEKDLLLRAEAMLATGAAPSTWARTARGPAAELPAEEETARLLPAIKALRREFPLAFLSADTFRASVAAAAVQAGADLVNDVGGGTLDEDMFATVGRLRVPYVLMHMRGTPRTMTQLSDYDDDLVLTLAALLPRPAGFAARRRRGRRSAGPGFGFAKTPVQGHELLRRLPELAVLGQPLLAGPLAQEDGVSGP
jgi:dihydropteroate synthase